MREDAKEAADAVRRKVNVQVAKPLFSCVMPDSVLQVPTVTEVPALGEAWDQPWLLEAPDALKLCMAEPSVSNSMTAWGGQYLKILDRQKMNFATHPLGEKNGRPEVTDLFMKLVPESQVVDLKTVPGGPEFAQAAWLFGCSRSMKTVTSPPNHACLFKALACGEIRTVLIETLKVREFLEKSGRAQEGHHLKDTLRLKASDITQLQQEHGAKVFEVVQKKDDVLYLPPLFVQMEVARSPGADANGSSLIYGCRKSFFMKRFAKDYELALAWTEHTASERMQQILRLMKT